MSDQDKNLIVTVGKGIVKAAKGFGHYLVVLANPVCRQCNVSVHPDYEFCSEGCALEYWGKFRHQHHQKSGRKVCAYPGCSKPCYVEPGGWIHDYCNKTHAAEYKALQDRRRRQHWQQQQPGSSHRGNGNSHHNHHQNTGNQLGHSPWWSKGNKHATGPIKFYNRDDPYYEFTNFYSAPIEVDRKTWPTTEHYFQAQKFVGTPYEEQIRHLPRPRQAFDFTRDPKVSRWRRNDWESIKEHVMYKALLAKFTQHDDLRKLLLETKERDLIEHSPYDSYWGDGGDGKGKNRLGELLMRLRCELRSGKKGKKSASVLPYIQQEATRENLQQSSQSGQGEEQSGRTPPTSAYGDLQRPPFQKQPSHPDDTAMDYQPSNSVENTTGGGPPGYHTAGGGALHSPTGTSAGHTISNHSQQPPYPSASNTPGSVSDGLQPSTATVHPSPTNYQPLPSHLSHRNQGDSGEDKMDCP